MVKALISLKPMGPPSKNQIIRNRTAIARPYGITNVPITYDPVVADHATDLPRMTVP